MNIEEVRQLIKQYQVEVEHLNDVKSQLDASRSSMTNEEYNKELENINKYLIAAQEKLQENVGLNNNYQSMLENLRKLNSLNEIKPRDKADEAEIENEREARLREVQKVSSALPEDLRRAVREQILNERQQIQKTPVIEEKNNNQQQIRNNPNKTRKEQLETEILRHQEGILHLDNMMRELNAARGSLTEEEYNREKESITRYIERETKKLADQNRIANAYDSMLSNIRKLNALDDIVPRDKQDEEQIQDEKEAREEEIKKAREMIPEELQQEIREIIQKEVTEKNAKQKEQLEENQQTEHKKKETEKTEEKKETEKTEEKKETEKTEEKKEEKKDFQQIMHELKKGLDIKEKSGKRYQAANIKVAEKFKSELKTGKFLYNVIHLAPIVVKTAFAGAKKLVSKFNLWRTEQTHTMDILKDRIENLSEDDLKVIMEEKRRREEPKVSKSEQAKAVMDMITEYQTPQHITEQATRKVA